MTRRLLCLGLVLLAGLGVALALELGNLIKDYGVQDGVGIAIFATDQPGVRALVAYSDDDESGGYTDGDAILGIKYYRVLRERMSEPLFRSGPAASGTRR